MPKILWYDGNDNDRGTGMDRQIVATKFGDRVEFHAFNDTGSAVEALKTQPFDAIITTTGLSRDWQKGGRLSGFVIQDEAVRLGLNTPRFVFTVHERSYMEAAVAGRYKASIEPPIVVERSRSKQGLASDIEQHVLPVLAARDLPSSVPVKPGGAATEAKGEQLSS